MVGVLMVRRGAVLVVGGVAVEHPMEWGGSVDAPAAKSYQSPHRPPRAVENLLHQGSDTKWIRFRHLGRSRIVRQRTISINHSITIRRFWDSQRDHPWQAL